MKIIWADVIPVLIPVMPGSFCVMPGLTGHHCSRSVVFGVPSSLPPEVCEMPGRRA